MRSSTNGYVLVLMGLAIWSDPASAADNGDALRCALIGDDQARLGVLRRNLPWTRRVRRTGSVAAGVTAGAGVQEGVTPVAAAPANPIADFGLTPARKESIEATEAKASGAPAVPKSPPVPDSITAKVATVAHRITGELVVILNDGQVWVQIDSETKGRVSEGEEVTIRKATLGSYFLVTPNHILVRVRRVK